jgi:fructose-1,6-bisphosphatase/inositol monophosphatase family enzyme
MTAELRRLQSILIECGEMAVSAKPTMSVEHKSDGSLVTNVDRLVESHLREVLPQSWNRTNVWGEEYGFEPMGENGLWLVDPIDGTSNFSFHNPLWGISIALADQQGLRLGAIILPELNIQLLSERGHGAYWNDHRMDPVSLADIRSHELVSCNERAFKSLQAMNQTFEGKLRLTGAFVVDGAFTVRQWFRAMYCQGEKLYDAAGVILAAMEIGLPVGYVDGSEFKIDELLFDEKIGKAWRIG